jgi:hypothetical protein
MYYFLPDPMTPRRGRTCNYLKMKDNQGCFGVRPGQTSPSPRSFRTMAVADLARSMV